MDELEEITLIEKRKFHERIISKIFKLVGYGLGSLGLIPMLSFSGVKPGYKAFHKHSVVIKLEDGSYKIRAKNYAKGLASDFEGLKRLPELIVNAAKSFPNKKFYGKRKMISKIEEIDKETSKKLVKYEFGDFYWTTFEDGYKQFLSISSSLKSLGLNFHNKMCLFANTSPEWLLMAFALMNISSPFGTVYSTLADESILYALNLLDTVGVFVDERTLPRILKMANKLKSLKFIIVFSYIEPIDVSKLKCDNEDIYIIEYMSLLSASFQSPMPKLSISQQNSNQDSVVDENLALIMFTSGSTGIPKGVMLAHKNILSMLSAVKPITRLWKNQTYSAFLPSSHIFEFVLEVAFVGFAGTIGYCTPLTLFDTSPMIKHGTKGDLAVLKPTLMVTVPLLLERLKKGILDNLKVKGRFTELLFETCFNAKMFFRRYGCPTPIMDAFIFKKLRNLFGGRLESAIIGGAYISHNSEEFAGVCMGDFKQGYGLTETAAGGTLSDFDYYTSGNIGPPIGCCEIKLIPWIEGGYDPNCEERKAGEIAIHGENVSMGYYKNEKLTKESFIKDPISGEIWFHTGDIGELLPDGTLRIIDRKKDIVKLQHGEYVSLIKIEAHISQNTLVEFICVTPSNSTEYLVALIIPSRERTRNFLIEKKFDIKDTNLEEYLKNSLIMEALSAHVWETINDKKLVRHEVPQKIHILSDVWSPENNLLTPTMKLKRNEITKKYKDLLN